MAEDQEDQEEMARIRETIKDGRIEDAVDELSIYLNIATEEDYLEKLENVIETLSSVVGGKTVLRFLIENMVIDIPSILNNLSKKDSILRYSFLLLLKEFCENESDLLLPYSEELLNSEDPNVRESYLQLLIFMIGGEEDIIAESLVRNTVQRLADEKDFVVEKAFQVLKNFAKRDPRRVTNTLKEYSKENEDKEDLKEKIDQVLKSIVSIDDIKEIEEEEEKDQLEKKEAKATEAIESLDDHISKDQKTEEKTKGTITVSNLTKDQLKERKEMLLKEIEPMEEILTRKRAEIDKLEEDEKEVLDKEMELIDQKMELKKKDMELQEKQLKLEEIQKELEAREIEQKEQSLKLKQELIEKKDRLSELTQVELELTEKEIKEKEKELLEKEAQRVREKLQQIKQEVDTDSNDKEE